MKFISPLSPNMFILGYRGFWLYQYNLTSEKCFQIMQHYPSNTLYKLRNIFKNTH